MKTKIVGILICMMLIMTMLPIAMAENVNKTEVRNEIKCENNLANDVFNGVNSVLPDGFEIKIFGTREIKVIEDALGVPPEARLPPNSVLISMDNRKGTVTVDITHTLSAKGGLLLSNKITDEVIEGTGILDPGEGGAQGGLFDGLQLLADNVTGFGLVKIMVSGQCNAEEFSQRAIGLLVRDNLILLLGGSKDTNV